MLSKYLFLSHVYGIIFRLFKYVVGYGRINLFLKINLKVGSFLV